MFNDEDDIFIFSKKCLTVSTIKVKQLSHIMDHYFVAKIYYFCFRMKFIQKNNNS